MSPVFLRILLILLAVLVATAGDEFARIQAGRGPIRESLGTCFLITGGILAALLAGCGLLPARRLSTMLDRFRLAIVAARVHVQDQPRGGKPSWCVLLASTVVLCSILAYRAPRQTDYAGSDQEAYVQTATQIAQDGGPAGLLRSLYTGQFAEANRHPLYLGLLSLSPTYTWGKWIAAGCAVLVHILGVWQMAVWYGRTSAMAFAVLNCVNSALVNTGVTVACETLVALCLFSAFWLAHLREGAATALPAEGGNPSGLNSAGLWLESPARLFLVASGMGIGLGAAWLAKGTALILVPVTLLWLIVPGTVSLRRGGWAFRFCTAAVFLFGLAVVTSPLLARNIQRFGSATHNVNSWLMFVDRYEDPAVLSESHSLGELARRYFREKGAAGLLLRELRGLVWESFILLRALGPAGLGEWRLFPGMVVAGIGFWGWLSTTRPAIGNLALLWTAPSLALFAWYIPIAAGERFPAPLVPILLAYAGIGWTACGFSGKGRPAERGNDADYRQ